MKLEFLGAAHEVTGSCHYLECNEKQMLIDCGMEQGADLYVNQSIPVNSAEIDYIFVTHAHIDHSGLIPLMYNHGFRGQIFCTEATKELCDIMLRDSAHIQEAEVEWKNRKARRAGEAEVEPMYTVEDAEKVMKHFVPCRYHLKVEIAEGITVRFVDAGHLLGSSSIEMWLTENGEERKIVFSGDIGNSNQPLIKNPEYIKDADYVLTESTYGDRLHDQPTDFAKALAEVIRRTLQGGGNLVIPAFSVGRTQEILYFIRKIKEEEMIPGFNDFQVVMDSPLAVNATNIFKMSVEECFDDEARELVKMGCFDMIEVLYGNTPDILSQLIRTMLIPKDGCEFIVADFSAIEARVLAWLAGEQWRLDAFTEGKDIYCASASQMFGVPVVKHGINGELRQKGKVAELACGYGGGAGALISMGALDMGLKEDELPDIISSWRDANPEIVKFWYAVEKAAIETVKDHMDRTVGRIGFQFSANTLWIVLPSGRRLAYIKPKLQPNRFGRMAMTFEGLGANNKWTRGETYSGKLTENITQATARDLLAEAMRRMELAGLGIVGHVHDEVILEVPKEQYTVDDVCNIMNQNPAWADGLPLSSAGYTGNYYFKD